jgi:hypothetical protein
MYDHSLQKFKFAKKIEAEAGEVKYNYSDLELDFSIIVHEVRPIVSV